MKAGRRILLGYACAAAFIALGSSRPFDALVSFLFGPTFSVFAFASLLSHTVPLALCGMGASMAFGTGAFTLGLEGIVYSGALVASVVGSAAVGLGIPPAAAILPAILAASFSGALLSGLSALLKKAFDAGIMITSFFVSQTLMVVVDWLIGGPCRDRGTDLIATAAIPSAAISVPVATTLCLVAAAFLWFYRNGTRAGYEASLHGGNPAFARSIGLDGTAIEFSSLAVAGALAGAAGCVVAFSNAGRAIKGLSGGMGWDAIGVALIAGNSPLASTGVALLYGWLDSGARAASVSGGLALPVVAVAKALLLATAASGSRSRRAS